MQRIFYTWLNFYSFIIPAILRSKPLFRNGWVKRMSRLKNGLDYFYHYVFFRSMIFRQEPVNILLPRKKIYLQATEYVFAMDGEAG